MWKLFLVSFLSNFVNEILTAKVGVLCLKGKGRVTSTGPGGTSMNLDMGTNARYEITIKKVPGFIN